MPRYLSPTLELILSSRHRRVPVDLVEINFPSIATLRYSTSPATAMSETWINHINRIREIRHSMESPVDRVGVQIDNKNGFIGKHVLQNFIQWQRAECIIRRIYRAGDLSEIEELFRGGVQRPDVSDMEVSFEVLTDTLTPGAIVATRNLGALCPWDFMDENCGYVGVETTCNKFLKSPDGCDGRDNTHRFGGWETFEPPTGMPPGTGGNIEIPPPIGGGGNPGGPGRIDPIEWLPVY